MKMILSLKQFKKEFCVKNATQSSQSTTEFHRDKNSLWHSVFLCISVLKKT